MNTTAAKPHTQINFDLFYSFLVLEYTRLFKEDADYAYSASKITPSELARGMVIGLDCGITNKDGKAVKNACKHFKIAHTYKAIREFIK